MNQATSRRLRARMLLLIVPLLLASAPSTPPRPSEAVNVPGQPDHLALVDLPSEFVLGRCMEFGVELRDITEAPVPAPTQLQVMLKGTIMGGAFYDQSGCSSSPVDSVDIPAGASSRQVWYLTPLPGNLMITASDGPTGPLGDASSKQFTIMQIPPATEFEIVPDSTSVTAGDSVGITVTAKSATGTDTQYAGTVTFSTSSGGLTVPPDYTFIPSVDHGSKKFFVTVHQTGTRDVTVKDTNGQITSGALAFTVQPGPTAQLQVEFPTAPVRAGQAVTFTVNALDAIGNTTSRAARLQFTTDVARFELPSDTPTTGTVSLPAQFTARFLSASPDLKKLTVTDVSTTPNLTQTVYLTVLPGPPAFVELSAAPLSTVPACGVVIVNLRAVDNEGNDTSEPISSVSLCKNPDRQATPVSTTLSNPSFYPTTAPICVSGTLMGRAQVAWRNEIEEAVTFTVSGFDSKAPLTVLWKSGLVSPTNSTLQFVESSDTVPQLPTFTGKLTLKLALRDQCGRPVALPADKTLSFVGDAPLVVTNPPEQDAQDKSVWTVSARLPQCPSDPSKPLAISLLINGAEPLGGPIQRRVQPKCVKPVEVKLKDSDGRLSVQPGAMTEFELEVSNTADTAIAGGVLMVAGDGLTVTGATLDGKDLTRNGAGTGFELPELRKDSPLKVKVQAQATTQLDKAVKATAWVVLNDSPLSEETPVDFTAEKLGVDVGCGCHSATPASQLLPWLLLLLAGSRPWGGLRRLRRGERTEH